MEFYNRFTISKFYVFVLIRFKLNQNDFNIFLAYMYVVWLVVGDSNYVPVLSVYMNCSQEGHTAVSDPLIGYDVGIHNMW